MHMSVRLPFRTFIRRAYRILTIIPLRRCDTRILYSAALAIGTTTYYARSLPKVAAETNNITLESNFISSEFQSWCYKKFLEFASLDVDGVPYMTPADFIRCSSGVGKPQHAGRRVLTLDEASSLVKSTPALSRSTASFFHDLGNNGLISFAEFMFLLSVLTQPKNSIYIAFQMFDKDQNAEVDLTEFLKITKIFSPCKVNEEVNYSAGDAQTTLVQCFFGKSGSKKLHYDDFSKFISNLQTELLRVEFVHFTASQETMTPAELAQSILRFTRQKPDSVTKLMKNVENNVSLAGKAIGFDAYKSLFNFFYVLEDFASALHMFAIAKHSISKDEFQRAARAVTGSYLDPDLVDILFILFDSDGDGHLSYNEFIETMRARGALTCQYDKHTAGTSRFKAFKRCVTKELL